MGCYFLGIRYEIGFEWDGKWMRWRWGFDRNRMVIGCEWDENKMEKLDGNWIRIIWDWDEYETGIELSHLVSVLLLCYNVLFITYI